LWVEARLRARLLIPYIDISPDGKTTMTITAIAGAPEIAFNAKPA
jgi:hypothetical protein